MKKKKRMKDDTKSDKRPSTRTEFTKKKKKKTQKFVPEGKKKIEIHKTTEKLAVKISGITSEERQKKKKSL